MKITYIENVRFPSERAHAIQIMHTCQELASLGHEVTLVTPDRRGRSRDQDVLPSGVKRLFEHKVLPTIDALSVPYIPRNLAYHIQRLSFIIACRNWKRHEKSERWYTRDPYVLKELYTNGDIWMLELHDAPKTTPWKNVRGLVKNFVVISNALRSWLMKEGVSSERVCVASDGWDPASFVISKERNKARAALGWKDDETIFIYAGGLFPWKGVDRMVEWWSKKPLPHARFVIVGGAEEDRARISNLVSSSTVQMHKPVPPLEVATFLQAADVGVLPTSPSYEVGKLYTSPLKLFEYLSAGLPILASDVPSSREVLDESTAKFFADENSFYEARQKILVDTAWKNAARDAAKKKSLLYTWAARAKKISEALAEVHG